MVAPGNRKKKGHKYEKEVADLFIAAGVPAERIPWQSARRDGDNGGDVSIQVDGKEVTVECKHHARFGAVDIYEALKAAPVLCFKTNHKKSLIVMTLEDYLDPAKLLAKLKQI